jgi:hypothetical protein
MKTFCCAAALAVVLSGCVSAPTKSLEQASTLQGKHVVVSHYAKPDFSAIDMAARRSATVLPASNKIATDDNPSSLVKAYPGADLILDVKTLNWMYLYYPSQWSKYHVMYMARVRLIDGKTGALVAQHLCKVDPTDPKNPPTSDALRADHAALLKQSLHKAADTCVSDAEQQAPRV